MDGVCVMDQVLCKKYQKSTLGIDKATQVIYSGITMQNNDNKNTDDSLKMKWADYGPVRRMGADGGRPSKVQKILGMDLSDWLAAAGEGAGKNAASKSLKAWVEQRGVKASKQTCYRAINALMEKGVLEWVVNKNGPWSGYVVKPAVAKPAQAANDGGGK
jgi:hypothetical protein